MELFDRILIASDLGPQSHTLVVALSDLIRESGSHVLLHYILGRTAGGWREQNPEDRWRTLSQDLLDAGVRRVDFEVSTGNPSHAIEKAAGDFAATLVVISEGQEQRNGQMWFGTVAQRLNRCLRVPLLVVPAGGTVIMRPLMCLVDSSDSSRAALSHAAALARRLSTSLTILHVVPEHPFGPVVEGPLWSHRASDPTSIASDPPVGGTFGLYSREEADLVQRTEDLQRMMKARREVEYLLSQVNLSEVNHEVLLLSGSPVAQTLSVARTRHCGMILVGSDHTSGLTHLMSQSSAEALVGVADVPVMICHSPKHVVPQPWSHRSDRDQLDVGL